MTTDPPYSPVDDAVIYQQLRRERAAALWASTTPAPYARARATHPAIVHWTELLVRQAFIDPALRLTAGPSMVVLGARGTRRTTEVWGAMNAIAQTGTAAEWEVITAPDLYKALRPVPGPEAALEGSPGVREDLFERYAQTTLLMVDDFDLPAAPSEWTRSVAERLIDRRHAHKAPTVLVSARPLDSPEHTQPGDQGTAAALPSLKDLLGARLVSQIYEMTSHIVDLGKDAGPDQPVPSAAQSAAATPAPDVAQP